MKAEDVRHLVVVGAGTMGAGIAGEMSRAGCQVTLTDVSDSALEQGLQRLDAAQEALISAQLLTPTAAAVARERVRTTQALDEACMHADLVIEAASERLELKEELFARFDASCPPHTVLASNTSGLSITHMATATHRPGQVVGMHFWNPPHIIPLVEITRGEQTDDATAEFIRALVQRIGKRPILVRSDIPGFVGNRLQFAVLREALHLLDQGIASAADIDTAMTAGPGLRYGLLGPLQTADLGGLDVFHAISDYLFAELSTATEPPPMLAELVRQGHLGAKSGSGFYTYTKDDVEQLQQRRDRVLLQFLKALRTT